MDFLGDIDWVTVGKAVAGLAPVLTVAVGLSRGPGALRSRLKHDAEVLAMLPDKSDPRSAMEAYVVTQIARLEKYETEARRDWTGAGIAVGLVAFLLWAAFALFEFDEWFGDVAAWALIVFAAAGLSVTYDSIKRVPRDEKDKPL